MARHHMAQSLRIERHAAILVDARLPTVHRATRLATPYTCCDAVAGLEGCIDLSGGTCTVDPEDPQVWCPPF